MPDMSQVPNNIHYTLIKGEPGTWKSSIAVTWPQPQYWFSFDGKMNALTIPIKKHGIEPKSIQFDDYTNWNAARQKLEQLQISCPFKTVIIDSITTCADYMLRQVIKEKSGKKTQSGSDANRAVGGITVNQLEDYNAEAAGLTELMALTKDIGKFHKVDIILIAHVVRTDYRTPDGVSHISRVLVTAGKKPAAKIPAYCDETYHCGWDKSPVEGQAGDLVIATRNNGEDYARTTLELPALIKPGNENFYQKYILPAIQKQGA